MDLFASCHCGAVQQRLRIQYPEFSSRNSPTTMIPLKISLCHCSACRHATGLLCTSYLPIAVPQSLSGTAMYRSAASEVRRYFCSVCGCHVFRSRLLHSPGDGGGSKGENCWEVATGVLNDIDGSFRIERHANVADTKDGGASHWIKEQDGQEVSVYQGDGPDLFPRIACESLAISRMTPCTIASDPLEGESLQATCQCGTVRFLVTRPDASSKIPRSPFPDLMIPYHTQHPKLPNPYNEIWWLRDNNTKYLAGTCACRSCRLTSGFEIQTWAFIPRSNIYFHISETKAKEEIQYFPLDFSKLPPCILQSYESSTGVVREFCGTCGATVFWHDRGRPDLVDVSVGLFSAREGARAENWLDWWIERVSFAEDAKRDRAVKDNWKHFDLIPGLERGLLAWGEEKRKGTAK